MYSISDNIYNQTEGKIEITLFHVNAASRDNNLVVEMLLAMRW